MLWENFVFDTVSICRRPTLSIFHSFFLIFAISTILASDETPLRFREMVFESKIEYRNMSGDLEKRFIVSSLGSGIALFDYDEDGDLDVYFVNGTRINSQGTKIAEGSNRLYRNEGNWRLVDVSASAGVDHRGWGLGCSVGDYDNDGFSDLYVTNIGSNVLYRNRGDGTFEDVTISTQVGHPGFGTSTLFFDGNGDGALDLYVVNYSESEVSSLPLPGERPSCVWFGLPVFCGPSGLAGNSDVYYTNMNDGSFTETTRQVGLFDSTGAYGLGVVSGDYDNDGDMDLYVANDSVPNFLYQNDGTGNFSETALFAGVAYNADGLAQAGMGVDLADLDGDGQLDLFVTNFSHDTNTMYRNYGEGLFSDATASVDLRVATWFYLGWATRFGDFDNDGIVDLFVANGHVYPNAEESGQQTSYYQRNQLFWNDGKKLAESQWQFSDAMLKEASSRGAAFGDIDEDGDIDIVVVNIDDRPSLLKNETGGNSVILRLIGRNSNRSGIGARVVVQNEDSFNIFESRPSGSYLSSNDSRIHIGMGQLSVLPKLEIHWPSGLTQALENISAGSSLTIVETIDSAFPES